MSEIVEEKLHFHQFKTPPLQTGQAWHQWRAEQLSEQYGYRVNAKDVRIHLERTLHDPRYQIGGLGCIAVGEWLGFQPGQRKRRYGKAEVKAEPKSRERFDDEPGLFE